MTDALWCYHRSKLGSGWCLALSRNALKKLRESIAGLWRISSGMP
ncbi:hypothetical protein SAMN03159391_01580 [Pseudomonas sp. NFACC37-1]|nr:hypothetical protein SAMN03159391_01580 [Pseudomonas sp. NFACC37-1]